MRFIVPFGRDGASDRAARAYAAECAPDCEIENVPGEGGASGVARANALAVSGAPTLLLGTPSTHILLPALRGMAAGPSQAFRPIAGLGHAPNVLLVAPSLGLASIDELVREARRRPLVYASAGAGQTIHVCTALFCKQAGISMTHRPYPAGSEGAYADIATGAVHVYFDNLLACRMRVERDEVIALAVSSATRSTLLPDVPTLRERGFDHALDLWLGVFGANMRNLESLPPPGLATNLGTLGLSQGPVSAGELQSRMTASVRSWRAALGVSRVQGGA